MCRKGTLGAAFEMGFFKYVLGLSVQSMEHSGAGQRRLFFFFGCDDASEVMCQVLLQTHGPLLWPWLWSLLPSSSSALQPYIAAPKNC